MKKTYRVLLYALGFIFFIESLALSCYAIETEVELAPVSQSKAASVFSNMNLRYTVEDPGFTSSFVQFDINENGDYALLFDSERETIAVYNESGTFRYALSISGGSSSPAFEFDGENIVIYRAGYAVFVDSHGMFLDLYEYYDSNAYLIKNVTSDTKKVNGAVYTAKHTFDSIVKRPLYLGQYSKLVKTTPNGEEMVLYKQSFGSGLVTFLMIILFISLFLVVFFFLFKRIRTKKSQIALRYKSI